MGIIKVQQINLWVTTYVKGEKAMATKKSTKKAKIAKKSNNTLFAIYGARESNSG